MSLVESHVHSRRKECAPQVAREFVLGSSPLPSMTSLLDEVIADGEFALARDVSEYFYGRHEGVYSKELFQVGLLDISLPFQRWMRDPNYTMTQAQRTQAYETAVNLSGLAIECTDLHTENQDRSQARGVSAEVLFYAGATRLMASSPDIACVILPAPLWMDDSIPRESERSGIDFITYYQDMIIPTQIKASRAKAGKAYREEILVLYMKDFTSEDDWNLSSLQAILQDEVQTRILSPQANSFQHRLFAKIHKHATSKQDLLRSDRNILFTKTRD